MRGHRYLDNCFSSEQQISDKTVCNTRIQTHSLGTMHCIKACILLSLCLLISVECKYSDLPGDVAPYENAHMEILSQISSMEARLMKQMAEMDTASKRLEASMKEHHTEVITKCMLLDDNALMKQIEQLEAKINEHHTDVITKCMLLDNCDNVMNSTELITGPVYTVPDTALNSSSNYNGRDDHGPRCSRLDVPKPAFCYSNSWCRIKSDRDGWIQVDLGREFAVTGVATRGRDQSGFDQWMTGYKMAVFRPESDTVQYYKAEEILSANEDRNTTVTNELNPPIVGRYIRLYPVAYHSHPSLRWELYGYPN